MRKTKRSAVIRAAVLVLAALATGPAAHAQAQTIQTSNAWARRAPAMESMDMMGKSETTGKMGGMDKMGGGGNGAVYVTLSNAGAQADSLLSASSEVAQTVELHEVKNEGGVMKMRPVQAIPVPAKGKTELKPGGYHIMLMGLKQDLKPGDRIPLVLKFEKGGEVRVEAAVR
jgi:copper(I)-binding protein